MLGPATFDHAQSAQREDKQGKEFKMTKGGATAGYIVCDAWNIDCSYSFTSYPASIYYVSVNAINGTDGETRYK